MWSTHATRQEYQAIKVNVDRQTTCRRRSTGWRQRRKMPCHVKHRLNTFVLGTARARRQFVSLQLCSSGNMFNHGMHTHTLLGADKFGADKFGADRLVCVTACGRIALLYLWLSSLHTCACAVRKQCFRSGTKTKITRREGGGGGKKSRPFLLTA